MTAFHSVKGTWHNSVDLYIALTRFVRDKFIEAGFPEHKLVVKNNFVYPDPGCGSGEGDYALFVGRLSPEKGLDTLLSAWKRLDRNWSLKIAGDGPMSAQIQAFCAATQECGMGRHEVARRRQPGSWAALGCWSFLRDGTRHSAGLRWRALLPAHR